MVPPHRRGGDQSGEECKRSVEHIPAVAIFPILKGETNAKHEVGRWSSQLTRAHSASGDLPGDNCECSVIWVAPGAAGAAGHLQIWKAMRPICSRVGSLPRSVRRAPFLSCCFRPLRQFIGRLHKLWALCTCVCSIWDSMSVLLWAGTASFMIAQSRQQYMNYWQNARRSRWGIGWPEIILTAHIS